MTKAVNAGIGVSMKIIFLCMTLIGLLVLQACGGGAVDGSTVARPQKTAIVEFAVSAADATSIVKGVTMVVRLPPGVTVSTEAGSTIINAAVLQGVNSFQILTSNYLVADNEVRIPAINISNTIENIVFARLTCNVVSGQTLMESQFTSLVPVLFDPSGAGGQDLKNSVNPKISVTFGY